MTAAIKLVRLRVPGLMLTAGFAAYAAAVGFLAVDHRTLAVVATAIAVFLALSASHAAYLAVVAVFGVWLVRRVPGVDVSITDVLLAIAGSAALVAGVARTLPERGHFLLRCFGFYLATLSVTLAFNQTFRGDLEWFHRIALVGGAVLVGAWLVQTGLHHRALQLLLAATSAMSLLAVFSTATSGFAPPHALGYQKNFVGSITATVLLVLLAAGEEFRLPSGWLRLGTVITAAGLLASQSRGAMVAVVVGALIWWFRERRAPAQHRRKLVALFVISLAAFASITIYNQLQSGSHYTSLTQRSDVERATRHLWMEHPLTGVGLRFFKTPAYAGYQAPNNVVNEVLAEAGVPGLLGFIVFAAGSLVSLARGRGSLATAALCAVAGRFVHGLVDIYWVGGTTALPWIIAGMGLASVPRRQASAASTGGRRSRVTSAGEPR